ncbi:secondary thiamine-phosphate synthase enzyme YjbQ [Candidatus Woesearchaeota archaeon]|nr:secondary thiamine-phosphate synthase enzyme YjbQ [Candidatus Woesearchaeota archaeon]
MPTITISTSKKHELIDITGKVREIVRNSKVKKGICFIYVPHATAAITINENADPNIQEDIIKAVNKIVPEHDGYLHDSIDNNAAAHIKSTLIGVSTHIPVSDGELQLGTWQDIFFCEFDGPRSNRRVMVNIIPQ